MTRMFENTTLKFYVLVPVYKVEKYIKTCIDSVLHQTYQNFQLVLVDDGSPDNSGKICDEYALMDKRIIVIHQANRGCISARQTAIQYVRQKISKENNVFIVSLDADDSLKEYALEQIYYAIQKYNCDMVIYGFDRVLETKVIGPYDKKNGYTGELENKRILYNIVFNNMEYNSLCRKAVSINLTSNEDYSKYFHIYRGEDLLQSIAFYKNCKKVYFLNDSLYNYTVNTESITQTVSEKNFKINFTVRQYVFEFLLSENVFTSDDWKQYRTYCIWLLVDMIVMIIKFQATYKQKVAYFNEIQRSEYYQKYIYGKEYNKKKLKLYRYVYMLFSKKMYRSIFVVYTLYQLMKTRKIKGR